MYVKQKMFLEVETSTVLNKKKYVLLEEKSI